MLAVWDDTPGRAHAVRGRDREIATLTGALDDAARGTGSARVILGRPGLGTTTLLDAMVARADGARVLRVRGTAAEADVPFAGLHQLVRPVHRLVSRLPAAHAEALRRVLALDPETAPSVAHPATHALLAAAAAEATTLCVVDAAHELDAASLAALGFAARRLDHLGVLLLLAADHAMAAGHAESLSGLPTLRLGPLDDDAARELLCDRLGAVPADLGDSLLDLARGNPAALTELASAVTIQQLSGRADPPRALPPDSVLTGTVRRRLARLPGPARQVVVLAAVDPRLDRPILERALATTGGPSTATADAVASGLVTVSGETVRPAEAVPPCTVLAAIDPAERRAAHRLLAEVADPIADRYRAVWHRAATADAPSPDLVRELDAVAVAARRNAGHTEAAAAGERAADLTARDADRARRLVAAAGDHWAAGQPQRARTMLRRVRPLGLTAEAELLSGEIELRRGNPAVAATELISTARRLVPTHSALAATTLMLAGEASFVAGDSARYCATARDAARIRTFDESPATRAVLEHFAAMSATFSGRHSDAAGPLRRVVELGTTTADPATRTLASQAAFTLGEGTESRNLAVGAVTAARARGEAAAIPWSMIYVAMAEMLNGHLATATASSLEGLHLAESLGQSNSAVDHLTVLAMLAALQGDEQTTQVRLRAASAGYVERGLSRPNALGTWAAACVDLAHDRPAEALDRFRRMSVGRARDCVPIRVMAVPHYVEAAVRCGEREGAYQALAAFERWATTTGGAARQALVHRCRALLAERAGAAREHFAEAIRLHREADSPYDLASTDMLYAARLRRDRQPSRAREVLREAVQIFDDLGARHWVARATRELRACGHPARAAREDAPTPRGRGALTPQQDRIAHLVAEGATNREIAARLYISHRTVDHHLRNIFARLGIRSRVELAKHFR